MTAGVRIDLPDLRSEQGAHLTHDPVRDLTAAVWTERWVGAPGDIVFAGGLRSDGLPTALSDPKRLAAVRATGLLDTGAEGPSMILPGWAAVTGCRRALITLVDEYPAQRLRVIVS
jgi:hypothetical protein